MGGSPLFSLTDRKTENLGEVSVFGCQCRQQKQTEEEGWDVHKISWQRDFWCALFLPHVTLVMRCPSLRAGKRQYQAEVGGECEGSSRSKVRSQ